MAIKMYILVRASVAERDLGHAILSVAHAAAAASRNWRDNPNFVDWEDNSFRKVLCLVTDKEFEQAKTYHISLDCKGYQIMTESGLNNEEISIVFRPREVWPTFFKFLKL